MRRDQHLIVALIRQVFGEPSKLAATRHFEIPEAGRGTVYYQRLFSNVNLVIGGCLACQQHPDALLVINNSGHEDDSSKVTSALVLMSAALTHSTTLTDIGGVAPAEWHGIFPRDYFRICAYSGCRAF